MLQKAPESAADGETETDEATDDALYCAGCGHLVTRGRWRLSINGHKHTLFNPAGRLFTVLCFSEAPGAADRGAPSDEFTWFKGYDWNFALCRGCGDHLGWRYTGDATPPLFFGLIKPKLTTTPPA